MACGGSDDAGGNGAQRPPVPQAASAPVCPGADLGAASNLVLVSTTGADSASCGATAASACGSIAQGLARCAGAGCAVLVRHGLYSTDATIELRDGVGLHGSCRFDAEPDRGYRTVIDANPPPGAAALWARDITHATPISGLVVLGKQETASGTASIVLAALGGGGLNLSRTLLVAGRGGDGAPAGAVPATPASANGQDASNAPLWFLFQAAGGPACPTDPTTGAGGGGAPWRINRINDCGFYCNCVASGGAQGQNGAGNPVTSGGAGGGFGGQGFGCRAQTNHDAGHGGNGGNGANGTCSNSGGQRSSDVWGQIASLSWQPGFGGTGGRGMNGSGGGGGGAGGVCARDQGIRHWFPLWGQPGGGGGAGGCGGGGGAGGQQGGASIALLLNNTAAIQLEAGSTAAIAGPGGNGGGGALGGQGEGGGSGGPGGNHAQCQNQPFDIDNTDVGIGGFGGNGGNGGPGGGGAGGAGGNGGPSIGVALFANAAAPASAAVYPPAASGTGGRGAYGGQGAVGIGTTACSAGGGDNGGAGGAGAIVDFDNLPS